MVDFDTGRPIHTVTFLFNDFRLIYASIVKVLRLRQEGGESSQSIPACKKAKIDSIWIAITAITATIGLRRKSKRDRTSWWSNARGKLVHARRKVLHAKWQLSRWNNKASSLEIRLCSTDSISQTHGVLKGNF